MKCPNCGTELEQETYYNEVNEDTAYYNYCPECDYEDKPMREDSEWKSNITKEPKSSIPPIRMQEIAEKAVAKLLEIDWDAAMELLIEDLDCSDQELTYFEANTREEHCNEYWDEYNDCPYEEEPDQEDDSNRGCKDCPPEECTGHCMSCYYRPV